MTEINTRPLTPARGPWLWCAVARRAKKKSSGRSKKPSAQRKGPLGWIKHWVVRGLAGVAIFGLVVVILMTLVNPPLTHTIWAEKQRLGQVRHDWVSAERIAPVMLRSVVAAEDANFCLHWGFDMRAIRLAIGDGAARGASTLTQQTVKNVFLWQGRSWLRKALEAVLTPTVEAVWTKRRILEVYLNVAEFGEGIFGVEAAARHYYGVSASALSPAQAARLVVLLPSPKRRDPGNLSANLLRRVEQVVEGAETIRADGRSRCFES